MKERSMFEECVGKNVLITTIAMNGQQVERRGSKIVKADGNLIKLDSGEIINTASPHFIKLEEDHTSIPMPPE